MLQTPRGAIHCISQRAEHIWEGVSSATTRSRPIINTRDEPHADAEPYRRLHVIVGDSNMNETTTLLKVAITDPVLRMIKAGVPIITHLRHRLQTLSARGLTLLRSQPERLYNGCPVASHLVDLRRSQDHLHVVRPSLLTALTNERDAEKAHKNDGHDEVRRVPPETYGEQCQGAAPTTQRT